MVTSALTAWRAPAKINLFLYVTGRLENGYHELQTAFQFLDYGDELSFTVNHSNEIRRSYDYGFSEAVDLCLRAAAMLKPYVDSRWGVTIGLNKKLPMGGGLGGGSSDAATVLIALNELWNAKLSLDELAEIGLKLGADVPVFVMGRAAWATGVGERLTPIELPEPWYLVLNPQVAVSTAQIFSNKHLTPTPQMKKIRALEKGIRSAQNIEQIMALGDNQLEPIVRAEYPEVDALLDWLSQYGDPRMSGSGGSVFLPLKDQQQGLNILAEKPRNSVGFVAKGLNVHPLLKVKG